MKKTLTAIAMVASATTASAFEYGQVSAVFQEVGVAIPAVVDQAYRPDVTVTSITAHPTINQESGEISLAGVSTRTIPNAGEIDTSAHRPLSGDTVTRVRQIREMATAINQAVYGVNTYEIQTTSAWQEAPGIITAASSRFGSAGFGTGSVPTYSWSGGTYGSSEFATRFSTFAQAIYNLNHAAYGADATTANTVAAQINSTLLPAVNAALTDLNDLGTKYKRAMDSLNRG